MSKWDKTRNNDEIISNNDVNIYKFYLIYEESNITK